MTDIGAPEPGEEVMQAGLVQRVGRACSMRYQWCLDRLTPYTKIRWCSTFLLFVGFLIRVILAQGWYVVAYALSVYLLSLFVLFLAPKIDPAMDKSDGLSLPTRASDEFRPFIRRLPEFKFWNSATRAVVVAVVCTFFTMLNVPVFWPILVIYFVMLFGMTMRRQLEHMIKYKYLPWSTGKTRYQGKEETN